MRHLKSGRQLNRTASHRKAMLANLATSILDKERVTTTVTKAKEVRSSVERLITYGKKSSIHAIRLVAKKVKDKTVVKKLFDDIAPGYKEREGGYTRIIRKGFRKGDNAELAIIELVGRNGDTQRKRKKKKKGGTKASVPQVVKEKALKNKKEKKVVSTKEVETEDTMKTPTSSVKKTSTDAKMEQKNKSISEEEFINVETESDKVKKTDVQKDDTSDDVIKKEGKKD